MLSDKNVLHNGGGVVDVEKELGNKSGLVSVPESFWRFYTRTWAEGRPAVNQPSSDIK